MSDLNHNNYAYLYGNTFVELCEEASRYYRPPFRPPYRPIDMFVPPVGGHVYGGHCCCNDVPSRVIPCTNVSGTLDGGSYDANCKCDKHKLPGMDPVDRDMPNIINIETTLKLSLQITLYGLKESDDIVLSLETGKQYTIKYLTECGLQTVTGVLTLIDSSIPLTPIRYIGQYNEYTENCYICIDCSTVGNSDRRKIFISTIRYIEEVATDTDNKDNPDEKEHDEDFV